MNKQDVVDRAVELGYEKVRDAKHGTLYRHPKTNETVSVPHTPGDVRSLKNTLAEVLRGAGKPSEDDSVIGMTLEIVRGFDHPLATREVADYVMSETGCTYGGVTVALGELAKRDDNSVVRVKRGWYVWDDDLSNLSPIALESALEYMNGKNPFDAWHDGHTRRDMINYGRDIDRVRSKRDGQEADGDEDVETEGTDDPVEDTRLFELVATEPGADGVAVIRDDEGSLWVARKLTVEATRT